MKKYGPSLLRALVAMVTVPPREDTVSVKQTYGVDERSAVFGNI
jgi:hypothetical protein